MTRFVLERLLALVRSAVVSVCAVAVGMAAAQAQPDTDYSEAEVKAAHLYHFATYVQWPETEPADSPITIAVLGARGVAAQLEASLPGRRIGNRAVRAQRIDDVGEIGSAHVLFIGAELAGRLADLIAALEGKPVLVVTDAPDGLDRGAMVNFQIIEQRVRFEISLVNAERARLMLSSRLLGAAVNVETTHLWIHGQPLAPMLAQRSQHCGAACEALLGDGHDAPASAALVAAAAILSPH